MLNHLQLNMQPGSSVDGSYSAPLLFEKLPGINQEGSQWTDCAIRDNINLIYLNLSKLDVYLSLLVMSFFILSICIFNFEIMLLSFFLDLNN